MRLRKFDFPLRVVFYYEEDSWVAHCLEFDLIGVGTSKEEALTYLSGAIATQMSVALEDNDPAILFRPADAKYLQMWALGKHIANGSVTIQVEDPENLLGGFDIREFEDHNTLGC